MVRLRLISHGVGSRYPMRGVSLTDQDFYDILDDEEVCYKYAIIVISIPKDADWTHPETGERRAYKFVSKVFGSNKSYFKYNAVEVDKGMNTFAKSTSCFEDFVSRAAFLEELGELE